MGSRKVLLVGWDAADWKIIQPLMDAGKMPNVRQLVENGAAGRITSLHPPLSPMLWTSICTGKRPFKHGIHGFSEPAPDGSGVRPVTNLSRKSKALWNILNQSGLRSVVVGWWPSHPAEPINGVMVSDHYQRASGPLHDGWPLPAHTVHPPELAGMLAGLRVHPDVLAPHIVEPFIPLAKEIDQEIDKRLATFLRTLAESMSIHAAAVWLLDNQPWDFFAVYYEAIDHFCHAFMRYHPPRQSWIGEREFELYHNVVSAAYQFHDEMLGTLLKHAGNGATVILTSDHGFHPDHLRPASIPDIPAGPAVEHRDLGVFVISGPGIKTGQALHGPSVLDVTPTILALYGLPVGEDMDGKVLSHSFLNTPEVAFIPSWEEIPGADGRHAPDTRLDPMAAREALEQMIALGYIERPDEDHQVAIDKTTRELRYNLGEAYQDAGRHREAYGIFAELYKADPDEQRFAVRLFVSCQALGNHEEMRRIVADLDGRRRALFEEAGRRIDFFHQEAFQRARERHGEAGDARAKSAGAEREPLLRPDERRELARWRNLARYQPPVTDYLKAQVFIAEKRYAEALPALEQLMETNLIRPGVFLQVADLYLRLRRPRDARHVYETALAIDPDNAQAHIGLCRMALRRRKYDIAAHSALDAIERSYHDPLAHLLLGRALVGMKQYEGAAEAFRAAIAFNPNFPEAHLRLAGLLEKYLGHPESAREHRILARSMKSRVASDPAHPPAAETVENTAPAYTAPDTPATATATGMPPLSESLIVVTGLPRSGTSLLMQMLAAGGISVLSDGLRPADEDNPRGYLEFEPVKNLLKDSLWLSGARGKAIKIVAPLLPALPQGLACRVILCERDLDEVLDSQAQMLRRRNPEPAAAPERRRLLKEEYRRMLGRVKAMLLGRPRTRLLVIEYSAALSEPLVTAEKIDHFLGSGLDVLRMAGVVEPTLHRNHAGTSS
ncbi:MAG TPA: alkaline phosphatase family protein [Bryobacteraceae bacterium]|nr:alkaline phosphatase family protein [Bryobacteraceae bacterium]